MRSRYPARNGKPHTVAPPPQPKERPTPPDHPYTILPLDSPDGGAVQAEVTFTLRERGVSIATSGNMTTNTFAAIFLGIWSGLPFGARFATHDLMTDSMLHEATPEKYPAIVLPQLSEMIAVALRTARTNGGIFVAEPTAADAGNDGTKPLSELHIECYDDGVRFCTHGMDNHLLRNMITGLWAGQDADDRADQLLELAHYAPIIDTGDTADIFLAPISRAIQAGLRAARQPDLDEDSTDDTSRP